MKHFIFIFSSMLLLSACSNTVDPKPVDVSVPVDQEFPVSTNDQGLEDTLDTNENDHSMPGDANLDNEDDMMGKIQVQEPLQGSKVVSPLIVKGDAVGPWFFEGSFPVKLLDDQGKELASTTATSTESWMTETMIPFEAKLTFDPGTATSGKVVLEKDNPSGLPENAGKVEIPVIF